MADLTYFRGPRRADPSVWCARWLEPECPKGVDVPGFTGGAHPTLCLTCELARLGEPLARAGEIGDEFPTPLCVEVSRASD